MANKVGSKVYIDTCIVSETYNRKISEADFKALDVLSDMDQIDFVVSDVMKEELGKHPDVNKRKSLAVLYKIFNKCKRHNTAHGVMVGAFGRTPSGRRGSAYDPLYKTIISIFTQRDKDPEHIFQAIKNECDYFLTIDYKSILKKAKIHHDELQEICPNLKFVSPVELLNVLKRTP